MFLHQRSAAIPALRSQSMPSQYDSAIGGMSNKESPLSGVVAELVDMLVEHMEGDEPSGWVDTPPGWEAGVNTLRAAGHTQAITGINELLVAAAYQYRSHSESIDPMDFEASGELGENAPEAPRSMAGNMPAPDAPPSEWVRALAAQPGICRGVIPSTVPLPPIPGAATSGEFPSVVTARRKMVAHYAIVGDLSLVREEEIEQWLAHPYEAVRMALLLSVPSVLCRSGVLMSRIAPSLAAAAIATGTRWSAPLEELFLQSWGSHNTPFDEWREALREHRLTLIREAADPGPFLHLGKVGQNLIEDLAQENRYLTRDKIAHLILGRSSLRRSVLLAAAENTHTPTDDLVGAVVDHLHATRGLGFLTQAVFEALSIIAKRPGGIPERPELVSLLGHGVTTGMSSDEIATLLLVPGMEKHPIIARRARRDRTPEVLVALARRAAPRDFGRHLGHLLTATSKMWSALDPFALPEEIAPCHEFVEEVLAAATPEQLAGVKPKVWAQAFQHPTAEVRLKAQMAVTRAAQATGDTEAPPAPARKSTFCDLRPGR